MTRFRCLASGREDALRACMHVLEQWHRVVRVELSLRTVYIRRWGLVAPVAVGVRISAAARARARKSGGCRRERKRNGESNEGSQCWKGDGTSRKQGLGSWRARFSMFCEGQAEAGPPMRIMRTLEGPRAMGFGRAGGRAGSTTFAFWAEDSHGALQNLVDGRPADALHPEGSAGVQKRLEARCAGCAEGGLGPAGGLAHLRLRDDRSCQGEGWKRWRRSRAI